MRRLVLGRPVSAQASRSRRAAPGWFSPSSPCIGPISAIGGAAKKPRWPATLFGAAIILAGAIGVFHERVAARLRRSTPWFLALGVFFSVWQATTAKFAILPQPFFPPPHALLEVFCDDWSKLGDSVAASIKLELFGFAARGRRRIRDRRVARLVARLWLLGASGHAPDRPDAFDRLAADRLFRFSVELERLDFPDRR